MKNWTVQIDTTTEDFTSAFGSLTSEEMNWKSSPETWSIGQNIDHLITINETYFPIIEELKKGTYRPPFIAKIGFLANLFGKFILNGVQPERKNKVKTFPIWEPSQSQIPTGILDRFVAHQEQLKTMIENSNELVKKGTVIHSPANRNIVYKLATAFDIIVVHEIRHYNQALEVLRQMKG